MIEGNAAEDFDAWHGLAHEFDAVGTKQVLFEQYAPIPGISHHLGELDLVKVLAINAGSGMAMNIYDSLKDTFLLVPLWDV